MIKHFHLELPSYSKGFHLITDQVLKVLPKLNGDGMLHLFIQHTSAALTINENADPTVRHDLNLSFDKLAPENEPFYKHTVEGHDDMPAHIKSILCGPSVSIPFEHGKLLLGTWQGIYLCEFREHATPRKIIISIIS